MLDETVCQRSGDDNRNERDRCERRRNVVIGSGSGAAVDQVLNERMLSRMEDGVINQPDDLEDRDEADHVCAQDEDEKGQH